MISDTIPKVIPKTQMAIMPHVKPGQIVFSKRGRDKGCAMVVLEACGEYVFLVDGRTRLISKPKKKKIKHIQPTNTVIDLVPHCGRALQDADIRKHLAGYQKGR